MDSLQQMNEDHDQPADGPEQEKMILLFYHNNNNNNNIIMAQNNLTIGLETRETIALYILQLEIWTTRV